MSTDPTADTRALDLWLAELRTEARVRSRSRTAWLERQADEDSSFVSVLVDLCDADHLVTLQSCGRLHHGRVLVVGRDVVVLRPVAPAAAGDVVMRIGAIGGVALVGGAAVPPAEGLGRDRRVPEPVGFTEVIGALAALRPRVVARRFDGSVETGELRAAGRDVARLLRDGDGGVAYVALASVAELSVAESG